VSPSHDQLKDAPTTFSIPPIQMSYVYNTVDLTNVKEGDRVLFRDGSIHTVALNDRTPTYPVCIRGWWYSASGVSCADSSSNQNDRDVIWIIPSTDAHEPIYLKDYKLEVGQYLIAEDAVYQIVYVDGDAIPVYAKQLKGVGNYGTWYCNNGQPINSFRFKPIQHVCAPLEETTIEHIDLSLAEVGDQVRLRNGEICEIEKVDNSTLPVLAKFWYRRNGIRGIYGSISKFKNAHDIVELIKKRKEIKRPDLTKAKVGDKVRLRNGEVYTVTRFENTNSYEVVELANHRGYYRLNGVLKGFSNTKESPLDIVELIPSITNPHRDLLLAVLTTKSETSELVRIDAAALHDLVKPIQDPNKVSKAFVDLLDGWQGPDISVPASYLKQLVEL
jgi:hypothetical protein